MVTCSQSNFEYFSHFSLFVILEQRVSRVHHLSSNIGKVPKRPTCDSKEPFYLEQPPRPPRPPKAKYSTMFLFMTISLHSHHTALMTIFSKLKIPCIVMGVPKTRVGVKSHQLLFYSSKCQNIPVVLRNADPLRGQDRVGN